MKHCSSNNTPSLLEKICRKPIRPRSLTSLLPLLKPESLENNAESERYTADRKSIDKMDLESVRRYIEKGGHEDDKKASNIEKMPPRFFERLVMEGLHIDLIEPGRVVCSMKVPPRLLNGSDYLHGGAAAMLVDVVGTSALISAGVFLTGVSVEINVSYLDAAYADEEIEIEAKVLRAGKTIGAASVEFRKKKTGTIIAQGRHTKYLLVSSKM